MGELNVQSAASEQQRRVFMKALLDDVRVLESMLETKLFERGVRRIGAEQEMFIVDQSCRPARVATELLGNINDDRFTYELAQFNLEANLEPHILRGKCLSKLASEANEVVQIARSHAKKMGADIVLTGILPSLRKSNLGLDTMVPLARYRTLNDALMEMRGSEFQFAIKGLDQLDLKHDNFMLEACNTSFQIHFQVAPEEFASLYNIAQAVTGPVLAAAVNSPLLMGKRLWHETRIAVFENSVDARSEAHQERGLLPRVHFGDHWIDHSVLEIFKEDIARFRVILTQENTEDPLALLKQDIAPELNALKLHNGTVYRWNRACYGVNQGIAHLRIENRVLPSGPTVADEIANASFFFGLMSGLSSKYEDIREFIEFDDVKSNFFAAAREGLKAQQTWFNGEHRPAGELIVDELLPLAYDGLVRLNIDKSDREHYLGIIEKRVRKGRTGAQWALDSMSKMKDRGTKEERDVSLISSMLDQQFKKPISEWDTADISKTQDWRDNYRRVEQFMTTDLFTVRSDDLIDFAASLMDWRHIRHVPVEDDKGKLVGIVSHRALVRMVARRTHDNSMSAPVRDIMRTELFSVTAQCDTVEAIRLMRRHKIGCLPVVKGDKLIGMVTQYDLIGVAANILEDALAP